MSYRDVLRALQKKEYSPLYILEGDEPYFIDQVSDAIENNILTEAERGFNLQLLYGSEVKPTDIINRAMQYPMFGNRQVIVVKEAQHIKDWEVIAQYAQKPQPSTVLAFCVRNGKLDKRTKDAKTIAKHAVVLTTSKLYDNQIGSWIEQHVKDRGYRISAHAVQLLAEYAGNDLATLDKEIGKLMLNVKPTDEITPKEIETFIGINKEYNSFELCKALAYRNTDKAHRIAANLAAHGKQNPFVVVLGSVYGYFNKVMLYRRHGAPALLSLGVNQYFIEEYRTAIQNYLPKQEREVMFLLNEYDLKSKNILPATTDDGALLREMVFKILHV